MLRLSDYVLSDDAYKVRLMLALLGVSHESEAVDVLILNEKAAA